jgi:dihydrofolate reductase
MRKLIITNIVSLDGFYEGPDGNAMALPMDHSFDSYNVERLREADTLLLGRNTYEGFKGFWPQVGDDPAAAAEQLGIPVEYLDTPIHREISRLENAIDKVVVSDSLATDQTDPWRDTTRIFRRADAHELIAELKRGSGGDILVFGSRTLWNDLLAARPRRRAAPGRRSGGPRRRHAGVRHAAGRPVPPARRPHVRRLRQRAGLLRRRARLSEDHPPPSTGSS